MMLLLLAAPFQLQLHDGVQEVGAHPNRVELQAACRVAAALFGAATWEGHAIDLRTQMNILNPTVLKKKPKRWIQLPIIAGHASRETAETTVGVRCITEHFKNFIN